MSENIQIKRALISVSDKTGIVSFARKLKKIGCEIISTGGTKKVLKKAKISVTDISEVTGNPEAFGGRMKTISFQIESALLFDRKKDKQEAEKLNIQPIDLVVCNLYPFEKVKNDNADLAKLIENIDIGGPTMVRAGAKNYEFVGVVVDPNDYKMIGDEITINNGMLSIETRFELMRKAYNHTADYDSLIATTMDEQADKKSLRLAFSEGTELRYGENSHQKGYFLKQNNSEESLKNIKILHGKELSYNNIFDMQSAIESVKDLEQTGCAIIKHANPCGLSEGKNQRKVFENAWAGDPVSSFGSVIAFNKKLEKKTVEFLKLDAKDKMERKFIEIIIAPSFTPSAKKYLFQHKNLRVIEFDPKLLNQRTDMKFLFNSLLFQDSDNKLFEKKEIVTKIKPKINNKLFQFGIVAMRQLRSNAIVAVRKMKTGDLQLLGMGCGQPNRVNSVLLTIEKCRANLKNEYDGQEDKFENYVKKEMKKVALFSDAFFPFPDNVELSYEAGIRTIIQPGGSIQDKKVIAKCDKLGVGMIFTGMRHFKH
ncbi:MAG: bifunctional phosphoribosylaminoimidazolecarboxamide formyltransferase/IMP cyclohydrolase [Candidatus Marinimicrobia bacterium]|nr:bifunctional phosphoribosylaminoimidazolecarboxamide formyltransferase/IMP cyclohydrolase [Candidatus Neomarinimicrobiota bacterium]